MFELDVNTWVNAELHLMKGKGDSAPQLSRQYGDTNSRAACHQGWRRLAHAQATPHQ